MVVPVAQIQAQFEAHVQYLRSVGILTPDEPRMIVFPFQRPAVAPAQRDFDRDIRRHYTPEEEVGFNCPGGSLVGRNKCFLYLTGAEVTSAVKIIAFGKIIPGIIVIGIHSVRRILHDNHRVPLCRGCIATTNPQCVA